MERQELTLEQAVNAIFSLNYARVMFGKQDPLWISTMKSDLNRLELEADRVLSRHIIQNARPEMNWIERLQELLTSSHYASKIEFLHEYGLLNRDQQREFLHGLLHHPGEPLREPGDTRPAASQSLLQAIGKFGRRITRPGFYPQAGGQSSQPGVTQGNPTSFVQGGRPPAPPGSPPQPQHQAHNNT